MLRFTLALLTLLTAAGPAIAQNRSHRDLILIAQDLNGPDLKHQIALLIPARKQLLERDVRIVLIPHRLVTSDMAPYWKDPLFRFASYRELRTYERVKPFTVILIGKDGGEKLRQHTPIPIDKLNAVIDAMPMRQDEMRQKK